jgi:predicted  nucleic acid-binding Zn-ribbon protein
MENINIWNWLIQQAPVVIVMGIVIWWLAKRLEKAEDEKDLLSKDVIKISTLWEAKADKMDEEDKSTKQQILSLLTEIKEIVRK